MRYLKSALCAATALTLITACSPSADTTYPASEVVHQDEIPHAQLPDNVVPKEYRVDLRMDPDADTMSGTVWIKAEIKKPTTKIWLHSKNMTVSLAGIGYLERDEAGMIIKDDRLPLTFTELSAEEAPSGIAHLTSETILPAGEVTFMMDFVTPYNQNLNSAYQVKRGDDAYIVTQFEPLGAREAFPSFDEPKYKVPFTLSITAPKDDFVYANTPETGTETMDNGWIRHDFAKTRPLPTYLVAFGAGPYDVNDFGDIPPNSIRKTPLAQRGITAKGNGDDIQYGLDNTNGILTALEEYFGTPYPYEKLDIIAAPDYAFGAMENPGAIVYREYLMLMNEDSSLSQKRSYARVHAHELAHQWFGNLVTPVWWEDIWLNEAFATWMGNKSLTMWKPGEYDNVTLNASLGAMNIDTLSTTRKVREPLERSENVMDQFDGITYRKGGGVLSMFESYLGEDAFQKGVRLHMERYADGVATGDDFFQSIADGSGNPDVVDAMKSFVDQPGLPLVEGVFVAETSTGNPLEDVTTRFMMRQMRYAPLGSKAQQGQSWQIPVCAKFGYGDITKKECTLFKGGEADITSENTGEDSADWVMPNADGAGYYRFTMSSDGWEALLDNVDQLNVREVLTLQDSLLAAYRAGEVETSVLMDGMTVLAKHENYEVAGKAGDLLGFMYEQAPEQRDKLAALVQDMYAARYKANLGKSTVEANLLNPRLAGRLVGFGQDETMRADFAKKGARYLGLDGKANKKAVAPNVLGLALREAMKARGEDAKAPLLALVKNGNSSEKGSAIGALAATKDKAIAAELRALALSDMDAMTGRQASSLIGSMMGNDTTGDETWDWLKANFEGFVNGRVPDVRKGRMPGYASGFCTTERRDEAEAFFEANKAITPGYERSLMQTLESIELCAALKTAKAEEVQAALKSR